MLTGRATYVVALAGSSFELTKRDASRLFSASEAKDLQAEISHEQVPTGTYGFLSPARPKPPGAVSAGEGRLLLHRPGK